MLKNFITISLRNLRLYKGYALINILGLALSMACGILIFTLVSFHLGFDDFHLAADRIYRVVTEQHRDNISYTPGVPAPLGKVFREEYTYAEQVARQAVFSYTLVTVEDGTGPKKFKEPLGVAFTEPSFLDIFNYPLIRGDKHSALSEPNTAVVTEGMARKYFGNTDVIGKTILINNLLTFKITGILKDLPANTDLQCPIYLSYASLKQYDAWLGSDDSWGGINASLRCYVRLKPGVSTAVVEKAMTGFVKKYRPISKNVHHYLLQPLSDMHFNAHYGGVMEKKNLLIFSFIGLFLIITACVNFINLATAQALRRSKEVGVRKVLGGGRVQIFWQFLAETGVITVLAAVLAIGISYLVLPSINDLFHVNMHISLYPGGALFAFLLVLVLAVSFLAGSYPGLILAGFQPVQAIKGKISQQEVGGFNIRRGLIVGQFTIAQVLIIGMIVIISQLKYVHNADPGFKKDDVVMLPMPDNKQVPAMKALQGRLLNIPGVQNVSACFTAPAATDNWTTLFTFDNRTETEPFGINVRLGDDRWVSTFDVKLVAGRNFFPSDTVKEFLVNETFLKKMNIPDGGSVIGKRLALNSGAMPGLIVGVVKDFHDKSFHDDIEAVAITTLTSYYQNYAIKINMASMGTVMPAVQKAWTETFPNEVYERHFVDEDLAQFYAGEDIMLQLIKIFTVVAIFIGCLGLYGLVSFMVSQKTKEIGIRKVLGGSVSNILWIFGSEFSRLILLALLIAVPAGWWLMSRWLMDFKFHISIGFWVFGLTALISVGVTVLAGGWQAIRAAGTNPVKALRSE
jgi:predicted permease